MSIFKDTFIPEVQGQLKARENTIKKRDVTSIKYLNSRNAWIRMSSSVNVNNDKGDLAKKNILQGGILSSQGLRAGVSNLNNTNAAYNQTSQRGLRPMPGINSIDIKSKSAYGSLREVVVKFQCWDIKQLEDLELLYMRPGYTTLIEWGWTPYLNLDEYQNFKNIEYNAQTFDIINNPPTKEKIWEELFLKSKNTGGNYDAMFGYVKNYSWSAREDGGYDCTTTIISIGEIIESLKVNYVALNYNINEGQKGIISSFLTTDNVTAHKKNILAGIFSEMYNGVFNQSQLTPLNFSQNTPTQTTFSGEISIDNGKQIKWENYDFFIRKLKTTTPSDNPSNQLINSNSNGVQIYITLESLIKILNEKILLKDKSSKLPLTGISVKGRDYLGEGNKDLLCLAHPLQISVDPTICLIGNPSWVNIQQPDFSTDINKGEVLLDEEPIGSYSPESISALKATIMVIIEESNIRTGSGFVVNPQKIADSIKKSTNKEENKIKELNRLWYNNSNTSLYDYLSPFNNRNLTIDQVNEALGAENVNLIKIRYPGSNDDKLRIEEINKKKIELENANKDLIKERKRLANAPAGTQYLLNLKSYNPEISKESDNKNSNLELGIIGNIYINLQFLYSLSLDNNIESQDKKEKQEISLYDFIKNIMSQVSNSIGSINNFDIHVDPIDNIARIIDINYVDETKKLTAYKNAFTLQMHNLESTVRSYKLESQIFPEQSTMIAIGSQVKSSALGMGGSDTMSSFNQNITDRIIPEKIDSYNTEEDLKKLVDDEFNNLKLNLKTIFSYFGNTDPYFNWTPTASFDTSMAAMYKTSLRDLINYFNSISNSSGKNRAIIPTKLSVALDGIGGLVIGHIFKIPDNLLPKGYKGIGNGSKLGHIITGIGHSISNSDWVTNIDAQTIILDEPVGGLTIDYIDLISNSSVLVAEAGNPNSNPSLPRIAPNYSNSSYQKAAKYAKRLMTDLGLTNFQAAGIFGNILYESGGSMDPDAIEDGKGYTIENIPKGVDSIGVGWAQWTNDRKAKTGEGRMDKFLFPNGKRKKRSELTDEYNYNYLIKEIKNDYDYILNEIKSSQNVLDASTIFLKKFEIPQNADSQKYFRAAIGDKILNLM